MKLEVKKLPLGSLAFDPENARSHGDENKAAVKASLQKFGQVEPLIVRKEDMVVIGGNCRLDVMRELGIEKAMCVIADIDRDDSMALSIALNRTGDLAGWDTEQLVNNLEILLEQGYETDATGFNEQDLLGLLNDAQLQGGFDEEPEKEEVDRGSSDAVKVVQLRYPADVLADFKNMVSFLGEKYELSNTSDIVFKALSELSGNDA